MRSRSSPSVSRRRFLGMSAGAFLACGTGARAAVLPGFLSAPPSERLSLALIGAGGRGSSLARGFARRADCRISWICDLDPSRGNDLVRELEDRQGSRPRRNLDYREVLADASVDAVVIATPDHWHGPLTVYSCQAGKDVYVEKPPSHNVWEGRRMVEAARRYGRVVQVGTQNRSAPYNRAAVEFVRGGGLGAVHLVKVFNLKPGGPYREPPDSPPPLGVDYDLWLGPAPKRPFNRGHFHGSWHAYWAYSGGDAADDGIHQLDLARWLIGKRLPRRVHATGGNLAFRDDREVPDTQVAVFDFEDLVLTFELTQWTPYMRKTNSAIREGRRFPYWPQNATRIELYGTKNLMIAGRHGGGWQVFTDGGKVIEEAFGRFPDDDHKEDFVRAVKERKRPSADIEEGHLSAVLVHLANIAYRVARPLDFDPDAETIRGDAEAAALLKRKYRPPYVIPDPV